ncbi:MAG: phosphoribosyltransferase family protein [Candidatus Micrarchaeota archaeon]
MARENWENKPAYTQALANKIRSSGFRPDVVVAIKSGGSAIGRMIAKDFGVPIQEITVQRRASKLSLKDGMKPLIEAIKLFQVPKLTEGTIGSFSNKKVLIVDNSVTTGQTVEIARRHLMERGVTTGDIRTASLYYLRGLKNRTPPDFYLGKRDSRLVRPKAPKLQK